MFKAQVFCMHKIKKIVMICEDKYFIFIIFQMVILFFESFDNSQKFAIIGFILYFC